MDQTKEVAVKWLSGLSIVMGAWLIISPFVLGLSSTSSYWNAIVVGIVVVALALYQLSTPTVTWPSYLNLIAGLWMVASPYMFNPAESAAYTNAVVSGIIVAALSIAAASTATSGVREQSYS